jgi:hypothetical protein
MSVSLSSPKLVNVDLKTGIHYGVIHNNRLGEFAWDDIVANGTDLDYAEAIDSITTELRDAIKSVLSDYVATFDADAIAADIIADLDFTVESSDCARYHYESESEEFTVGSDGDIFVTRSKYYTLCGFCSPCAPNAGYLESRGDVKAYCLGPDWFDENNPMPYEAFIV